MEEVSAEEQQSELGASKLKSKNSDVVDLSGTSAHPMFMGAMLSKAELDAVEVFMNPPLIQRMPSFYGTKPSTQMVKQFGSVIVPSMLGAAEVLADTNHPIYADVAASCAQRLPESVLINMKAGAS